MDAMNHTGLCAGRHGQIGGALLLFVCLRGPSLSSRTHLGLVETETSLRFSDLASFGEWWTSNKLLGMRSC